MDIQLGGDSLNDDVVVVGASAGVELGGMLRVKQVASEVLGYGAAVPWSIASRRSRIHMRVSVVGPMPFFWAVARRVSSVSAVKRTVMPWERFLAKRTSVGSNSSLKSAVVVGVPEVGFFLAAVERRNSGRLLTLDHSVVFSFGLSERAIVSRCAGDVSWWVGIRGPSRRGHRRFGARRCGGCRC